MGAWSWGHRRYIAAVARISRRETIRLIGASAAGLRLSPWIRQEAKSAPVTGRPNILVLMTDDQRQDAMSVAGNTVLRTPHMDRIAKEGVRFTEAFVTNSLCGPSRASFLTGLYSHAHGVISNGDSPAFGDQKGLEGQPTFVEALRSSGYYTGLAGKWHLKSQPTGFDQWIVFHGQGSYTDPRMIANGVSVKMRGNSEDIVGDQSIEFLERAPRDKPFCLLSHFKAPHRNWVPAPRFAKAFEDVDIPIPRTLDDSLQGRPEAVRKADMAVADMPDYRDRVPASLPAAERRRLNLQIMVKDYYRTLLAVDENVGRILDYLDQKGLAASTLVFYTSDNGFFLGQHGLFDKRLMYEDSIRVPMLARLPSRAPAGVVDSAHMVLNVDLAPTLLDLAGVPPSFPMHGRSFLPLLERREIPWRDAFLYEYYEYPAGHCARKNRGIRTDRWKLIHFWEQPEEWELYDLKTDPDEMVNLAGRREHRNRLSELKSRLASLRKEVGDSDPPGPAPAAAPCSRNL
jgi:arylsulfatase A-like enzyme